MRRILIDICHPAHIHFFKNSILELKRKDFEVLVTSRDKDVALELLGELGIEHIALSSAGSGGVLSLLKELISRNISLYKVVRNFKPDVMVAVGGIFVAQVGCLTNVPSLVFYDTENARLQNALTYPFVSCLSVPRSYEGWLPRKSERYAGYHELAYLHPYFFKPDINLAVKNGLAETGDTFFVRVVSWNANHDLNEEGWSVDLLRRVVEFLAKKGKVIVSSEARLPDDMASYSYQGSPSSVHHVMAFSRLYIGESATMASESVVLGVPSIYAAHTGRGYCNEQEARYGMLLNVKELGESALIEGVEKMLDIPPDEVAKRHQDLLNDTINVVDYTVNLIETMAK